VNMYVKSKDKSLTFNNRENKIAKITSPA